MQCKCGGVIKTKQQPKVKKGVVYLIAELDVCTACLRNASPVRVYDVDSNGEKQRRLQ